jgi:hypothetical protein
MWKRCKHVKSQATTVYFRLGKLRRVYTYVQHIWGIIGHVTVEAGNAVGTDGAPPQLVFFHVKILSKSIFLKFCVLLDGRFRISTSTNNNGSGRPKHFPMEPESYPEHGYTQ